MKTFSFSLLLLITLVGLSNAQNVFIPDSAFLHRLIDEGVDTDEDSLISFAEAELINYLDISGGLRGEGMVGITREYYATGTISDLAGIEAFINLDTLICGYNRIDSLNISHNENLKYLDCRFNDIVPYSDWTNNGLVILDISVCKDLMFLDCSANSLKGLDISKNTALEELNISVMPTLEQVCVWESFPTGVKVNTEDSPNVWFTTECSEGTVIEAFPLLSQNDSLPDTLQVGKYTVAEWKTKIDTMWKEGLPTEDKLILFDRYWEAVDQYYPGYINLAVNWDSVKNQYRPEIEGGVSKGRFAGIITKMGLLLQELHTESYNNEVFDTEPHPGIPLVVTSYYKTNDTVIYDHGRFGAVLTPTNDDNLLVLRAVNNHPLGLEPGDIIFGYDGMKWKDTYPLLLKIAFPVTSNNLSSLMTLGSSVQSAHHKWLSSAGLNWHLFDTLDYQKYGSTDTIHASTDLLIDKSYSLFGTEQLPVEGIEFPGSVYYPEFDNPYVNGLSSVIYDRINNYSIAYIYITHGFHPDITNDLLQEAFSNISNADVDGLILDLRFNTGGNSAVFQSFNQIFNQDFGNSDFSVRKPDGEHSELEAEGLDILPVFNTEYLNKPIALLTGPGAVSLGDYLSYLINVQPTTRSFGKPSNGAFTIITKHGFYNTPGHFDGYWYWDFGYEGWTFSMAPKNYTIYNDGEPEYMIHKGVEVDEEIWFTQEAAHHQQDNMVERAVEWIKNVAYTRDAWAGESYAAIGSSITLKAEVVNSSLHELQLDGDIFDQAGTLSGTVVFTDDGLNGDDIAEDGVWNALYTADSEAFFTAHLKMTGEAEDACLSMPLEIKFTSVPRPEVSLSKDSLFLPGENENITLSLKNISTLDIPGTRIDISSVDSTVVFNNTSYIAGCYVGTLSVDAIFDFDLTLKTAESVNPGDELPLAVKISSNNIQYWMDTLSLRAVIKTLPIPGGLEAANVTMNTIDLIWDYQVFNSIAGFIIYADGVVVDTASANSYTFLKLDPGTTYLLALSAYNQYMESEKSDEIEVTTLPTGFEEDIIDSYGPVIIYPNPTNKLIIVETKLQDHCSIEITSLHGKLIYYGKMEGTSHWINLSPFPKGVYFITIRSKDFVTTRKIIKL